LFSSGGLVAVLHVKGKSYVVRRPFNVSGANYVFEGTDLSRAHAPTAPKLSHEEYVRALGFEEWCTSLSPHVPRNTRPLEWGHLLAWCTRDQEARFQNIHNWREARSQSDSPDFSFQKEGPLYAIRAFLGLIDDQEESELNAIGRLEDEKKGLEQQIVDLVRVQKAVRERPARELRKALREIGKIEDDLSDLPAVAWGDLDSDSLQTRADSVLEAIKLRSDRIATDIGDLREKVGRHDRGIERLLKRIQGIVRHKEDLEWAVSLYDDKAGAEQLTELERKLFLAGDATCEYGHVLLSDCVHIGDRLQQLRQASEPDEARSASLQDQQSRVQAIAGGISQFWDQCAVLKGDRLLENTRLQIMEGELAELAGQSLYLKSLLENATDPKLAIDVEIKEKISLEEQLSRVTTDLATRQSTLAAGRAEINTRLENLERAFEECIRGVQLHKRFKGKVSLPKGLLRFDIDSGGAMSGEAVSTLGVLLADLACMLYSLREPVSLHPRFLIHDSPREADLGLNLYGSFQRFAAELGESTKGFQMIFTTTTPPPTDVWERFRRLPLESNEYLLLKELPHPGEGGLIAVDE
jgi:hypothetical protein